LPRLFDYQAGDLSISDIGRRVWVPFGRKHMVGLVIDLASTPDCPPEKLKALKAIDRVFPPLPRDVIDLFRFCADYYHYPIGQVAFSAMPTALRRWAFLPPKPITRYALTDQGRVALPDALPSRAVARRRLATRLQAGPAHSTELNRLCADAPQVLQDWLNKGWLAIEADAQLASPVTRPTLLEEQQAAVQAVSQSLGKYSAFLLHGITGSGKTEVYLHLVEQVLGQGQQALILVPEIGLTPQFAQRVAARFPGIEVGVLHSGLSESERLMRWKLAMSGKAGIVLGTRLSVFTPMPTLGLIIVDEEHDASFSQQEGLRYSARDLAVFRARQRHIPVVLGSATPSLESWQNAEAGRYNRLTLPVRATGASLPSLSLIDIRNQPLDEGLSPPAINAIGATLARGEQVLVFINRRGYAPVLHCPLCAWVAPCLRCSTRLTLHRQDHRLRCHHCGHEEAIPAACPACGNPDIRALGQGTQRVEEALERQFPAARILRADRDSTRRKGSWDLLQAGIHRGEVNLIVGTQLISKGHDFPNLTLVVVLEADGALFSLDFRAEEKLFAQLMQVSGRAGRADKPGTVLIQTRFPEHPLFSSLLAHDYGDFAALQLASRKLAALPPYSHQVVLRAEARTLNEALSWLAKARGLVADHPGIQIFAPVSAPMLKKAGMERAQLWLQSASRNPLQRLLHEWAPQLYTLRATGIRWHLDVDPAEN
jgi:primosomal protein N' (replication factor Y) (superfamily II helicase)